MTDRQPAAEAGARRGNLRRKLLLSHLRVAAIGVAILLIASAAALLLRVSALRLARERGPVVNASLQTLSGVQRSVAELSGWVAFRDDVFRERRAAAWTHEIRPALLELDRADRRWGGLGDDRVAELKSMLDELEALQRRIEVQTAEQAEGEEQATRDLMAKELVPLGRRVIGFLRGVSAGQMALMEVDADSVSVVSRVGLVLGAILLVAMVGITWSTSVRGADRITKPILDLAAASESIASGRLSRDVALGEDDEIGQLADAFNSMRSYLARTTASIRETATRLTDATAQILAATTQQAKGAREQVAAVRTVLEGVADASAVSRTVVQRARGVGSSVEVAVANTGAGRAAIEESIAGAGSLRGRVDALIAAGTLDQASGRDILNELGRLTDLMRSIHETTDTLSRTLAEAAKVTAETDISVGEQARRLHDLHGAIERLDQLGENTMERTFQVEHVAQDLKAYNRALGELLASLPQYDRGALSS